MKWIHKKGHSGQEVRRIQRQLSIHPDGKFGDETEAAVKQFQSSAQLLVDGQVGPQTRRAMEIEMFAGIDVSRWNNITDWKKLKDSGLAEFCWVKATEGNSYVCPFYKNNCDKAEEAGIPFGVYHFARPDLHLDPYDEVRNFVRNCHFEKGNLRPVLDFEKAGDHSPDSIRDWVLTFLEDFERQTDIEPIVYTGGNMTKYYLRGDTTGIDRYMLWHAWYNKKGFSSGIKKDRLGGWKEWKIWQWTGSGTVPGSEGNIDRNWLVGGKTSWNEVLIN